MSATDVDQTPEVSAEPRVARIVASATAVAMMTTGLGLAAAAAVGQLGEPGWPLWLALVASPVVSGAGALWFVRGREQVRRESAWDIFVERELERESERPRQPVQVGKLVEVRSRHRRKSTHRSRTSARKA